jgi:hypothetical protein
MRTAFDKLNDAHAKYYNPTENFAVNVITVLFKVTVIYRQHVRKKYDSLG